MVDDYLYHMHPDLVCFIAERLFGSPILWLTPNNYLKFPSFEAVKTVYDETFLLKVTEVAMDGIGLFKGQIMTDPSLPNLHDGSNWSFELDQSMRETSIYTAQPVDMLTYDYWNWYENYYTASEEWKYFWGQSIKQRSSWMWLGGMDTWWYPYHPSWFFQEEGWLPEYGSTFLAENFQVCMTESSLMDKHGLYTGTEEEFEWSVFLKAPKRPHAMFFFLCNSFKILLLYVGWYLMH